MGSSKSWIALSMKNTKLHVQRIKMISQKVKYVGQNLKLVKLIKKHTLVYTVLVRHAFEVRYNGAYKPEA